MSALEDSPDTVRLDNDVRTAVYTTAAHSGDSEIYNQVSKTVLGLCWVVRSAT